ncbi:MAG: TonB-dependent receptor [Ignavibacteriales bacterium]|nr:TonB-dependent receptor [Ignavibacteriales bacterium]
MTIKKINLVFTTIYLLILLFSLQVNAQPKTSISGKVFSENDEPLEGANLFIKDLGIGTATNHDGQFTISNIKAEKIEFAVSCVGYEMVTREISMSDENINNLIIHLRESVVKFSDVVVTGTRTEKKLSDTPVRTEIIGGKEIKRSGFTRLDDVLIEQTGLAIINDHGKGVQMQGLDPAYTLILIDGEPVIGRTAGTLELSRFNVTNLKQIEIVKGPSSSLYGSEALAGVINLITENPSGDGASLKSLYGTNNTIDLNLDGQLAADEFVGALSINSRSSDGYDLTPESQSSTTPQYMNYSINPKFEYKLSESSTIKLNGRIFFEEQKNSAEISANSETKPLDDKDKLTDWNGLLSFINNFSSSLKAEAKFYLTQYLTKNSLTYKENGESYEETEFNQHLYKGELFVNLIINKENLSSFGTGYQNENVKADRIVEGLKKANLYYAFLQHEWIPSEIFDFVLGARFDSHSDYSSRLSPKFSFLIKPITALNIRGSIGSGFKAPTMQQLYLDFTNPTVGYTVLGASNFYSSFEKLLNENQIDQILIDPSSINKIKAENSFAFNLGFEYTFFDFVTTGVNFFRNNVHDLIDASPAAIKKNGQSVFTYLNLNKIYTQGIECEISTKQFEGFAASFGYQYLEAIDEEVIDKIRDGKISKTTPSGRVRPVKESEYGGLYNRSKHSGTVRISYTNNELGLSSTISGIIRGKYGYGDINGNNILDDEKEYVQGYALWNFTAVKSVTKNLSLQLRIENLFDKTNTRFIPSMPGRIFYAGVQLEIGNK